MKTIKLDEKLLWGNMDLGSLSYGRPADFVTLTGAPVGSIRTSINELKEFTIDTKVNYKFSKEFYLSESLEVPQSFNAMNLILEAREAAITLETKHPDLRAVIIANLDFTKIITVFYSDIYSLNRGLVKCGIKKIDNISLKYTISYLQMDIDCSILAQSESANELVNANLLDNILEVKVLYLVRSEDRDFHYEKSKLKAFTFNDLTSLNKSLSVVNVSIDFADYLKLVKNHESYFSIEEKYNLRVPLPPYSTLNRLFDAIDNFHND